MQNKKYRFKRVLVIQLENIRGRKFVPPMRFNVTELHCLERNNSQKQNFSQHHYFIILGSQMIKISGLDTDLG